VSPSSRASRHPVDPWLPASVKALRSYSPQQLTRDALAGLTVGLVALPLAMAFAISSGMTPQAGLYCAVVTGFLVSALGGSNVQIGGPTGAFVVVVSGIVAEHGVDGLFMCTMMAGVLLIVMGVTGSGTAVRFIPRPVVIGFTNGIALVIASTQLKDLFGTALPDPIPGELVPRMALLVENAGALSVETTGLGLSVLAVIIVWNRLVPRVPGYIVAVEAGMILAALLFIRRVASTTTVSRVTRDYVERGRAHILQDKAIPPYLTIFRIHGPFLFGATDKLSAAIAHAHELTPIVVLRLRNMTAIDATGHRAIQDFADALRRSNRTLLICGAPPQPARLMAQAEFHRHVGAENILPNVQAAIQRAEAIWQARGTG
jgi:SulP family sulfate permease